MQNFTSAELMLSSLAAPKASESLEAPLLLAQAEGGGLLPSLLPLLFVFLIFYFLLIRPQSKRQKAIEKKRQELKKGDTFITAGGLYAKVSHFKNEAQVVVAEISPKVRVEVARSTIVDVIDKEKAVATDQKGKENEKQDKPKDLIKGDLVKGEKTKKK